MDYKTGEYDQAYEAWLYHLERQQKASIRRTKKISAALNAALVFSISLLVGGGFFFSLTRTLDNMTQRDCDLGIQQACEDLK